ncbi:MAG: RluA family pseudouridine synthase [Planctomycetales bacterium]
MHATHTITQPAELLPFLFAAHPEVKRTKIRQWLKYGSIQVNGLPASRTNHPLQVGDVVLIAPSQEAPAKTSLPAGLRIVFEDESLLVIDKPENLLSMASDTEKDKTVYAFLTDYVRRGNPRSPERVWIVHRLDFETSGLMVFARTEDAKRILQENWDQTEKRYLAVVEGAPPEEQGTVTSHLDESGPYKVFSAPAGEQTRLAITDYKILQRSADFSQVELILQTGRRNQIRVHMADLGCPVVGDRKYGAQTNPARRVALHASFLRICHPVSGEFLNFESPLPGNLARLL